MVEAPRVPRMIMCPVCGYDPDPPLEHLSDHELLKQRIRKIFAINAEQSWWLEQTEYVCKWLKDRGLNPKYILEAGCGDGRWIYGIRSIFPEAKYIGVERLEDHCVTNKEKLPEVDWVYADFCTYMPASSPDAIFIMGTFNPILSIDNQNRLMAKILELAPENIVILFDKNQTGRDPKAWLIDTYDLVNTLNVDREYQSQKQDIVVWRYVKK